MPLLSPIDGALRAGQYIAGTRLDFDNCQGRWCASLIPGDQVDLGIDQASLPTSTDGGRESGCKDPISILNKILTGDLFTEPAKALPGICLAEPRSLKK